MQGACEGVAEEAEHSVKREGFRDAREQERIRQSQAEMTKLKNCVVHSIVNS